MDPNIHNIAPLLAPLEFGKNAFQLSPVFSFLSDDNYRDGAVVDSFL